MAAWPVAVSEVGKLHVDRAVQKASWREQWGEQVKGNGKAIHAGEKQMGGVWRSSADGSG